MNTKLIVISDVHLSLKNLDVSIETLTQALKLSRDLKVPLFIAGDLNDGKALIRSEWANPLIDLFNEYNDVLIYILIGNHDLQNKNASSNSLYFLKALSNVCLIDKHITKNINGIDFGIIPYQVSTVELQDIILQMKDRDVKSLLIHQGIWGAYMGDYIVDESSISPDAFKDFDFVGSGHYHRSQRPADNILYWGSPFTTNFSEANEEKFIWKVELLNDKINTVPVMTNVRRHKQIVFEDSITQVEKLPANSLVKVLLKGTKEFTQSVTVEYLKELLGVNSVTISTEITKQSEQRVSSEILNNPIKVIEFYLANCKTTYDKLELEKYFKSAVGDLINNFSQSSSKQFRLKKANWNNFLSFKEESFEYSPMGLTLIEGYDEDLGVNTGSGKSSFLDVPCYGMYGETSKSLKADEVINRQVGRDLFVELFLESNGEEYIIRRYRKHRLFENDLHMVMPNGQELRGKDNRETQKLIEQELGKSLDIFLKSSYFTQFGPMDRFLSASDTEKKQLIAEITDLSIYDTILDRVKDLLKEDQKSLDSAETQLKQDSYVVSHLNVTIQDNTNKSINWNIAHNNRIIETGILVDKENIRIANDKIEFNNKSNEWLNQSSQSIKNLKSQEKGFEQLRLEMIDNFNTDLLMFNANQQGKIESINNEIEELRNKITPLQDKHDELLKTLPDMLTLENERKELLTKKETIAQLKIKEQNISNELFSNDKQIEALHNKIAADIKKINGGDSSECPHCYQELDANCIHKNIEVFQHDIDKLDNLSNDLRKKSDAIKFYIDQTPQVLERLQQIEKSGYEKKNIELELETILRTIKSIGETIKFKNDMLDQINSSVSPALAQIENKKKEANPYTQLIINEESKTNPYLEYRDIENKYILSLENLNKEINPYLSILEQNGFDIQQAQFAELKGLETLDYWVTKVDYGTWWKQALHVYIKSYLMDSCFEQINIIANEHLNTLFDGVLKINISATTEAKSDIKEKISVQIINNGDECSYNSLSGGERARICLALNLSLAKVIAKSSGNKLNWIALDEILNGLDEVGKAQTMKFLKELESEYETIFVIDHDESFKSMFTNSISIVKKSKVSTIV